MQVSFALDCMGRSCETDSPAIRELGVVLPRESTGNLHLKELEELRKRGRSRKGWGRKEGGGGKGRKGRAAATSLLVFIFSQFPWRSRTESGLKRN